MVGVFPVALADLLTGNIEGRTVDRLNVSTPKHRNYPFTVGVDDQPFRFTVCFLTDHYVAATSP